MDAAELMRRIAQYGGDMAGIQDRFMGNEELYESCFSEFLAMPEFAALDDAMRGRDYERAFKAAHAIKGVAGNLGLTRYFRAISALVEILRAKDYARADAGYAHATDELAVMRAALCGGEAAQPPAPEASAPPAPDGTNAPEASEAPAPTLDADEPPTKPKHRADMPVVYAIIAVSVVALIVCLMFGGLVSRYRDNAATESAAHLTEISHQIKLYTEAQIENDWVAVHSVANSIQSSDLDDDALLAFIRRERVIRDVADITIYMEDGYAIRTDGSVEPNDESSALIVNARQQGAYMNIIDSDITYVIPVLTDRHYHGSRVVAVSVRRNLSTFLDNMNFHSFDGSAYLYLTQENGVVVSMLSHVSASYAYNIFPMLQAYHVRPLLPGADDAQALLTAAQPTACVMDTPRGAEYVISTPISSRRMGLRLFFIAPQSVVNKTTNSFSGYVMTLSAAAIVAFMLGAAALFVTAYLSRRRTFDKELKTRDRMFDLLVLYSQTAFGLFSAKKNEPLFISSNASKIIGEKYLSVVSDGDGYRVRGAAKEDTEVVRQINERMEKWDGHGAFRSGFVRNPAAPVPSYFELQVFPVADDRAQFVAMAQDVTQAYERDLALHEALQMARQASEAKSRFLSNTSHDIRTPMNAIINMTRFARESLHDPRKASGYLELVEDSADHLLQLVNDVLDMSRVESGQMVLDSRPLDLRDELTRIANTIRPLCMERQQYLVTDFDGIRVDAVLGDALKLSQVLINLLSNAVKFTPKRGAVRFVAKTVDTLRDDMTSVRFSVEDTGIGIAKDDLDRIFDPFTRVDDQRVNRVEGTGLGLSICKSYVTAMGGTLRCESEPNEGSVFIVELAFPIAGFTPESRDAGGGASDSPFLGRRCLLCEDNQTNQIIARTMLERAGFMTEVAGDGAEGLKRFLGSKPGYYDLIYMDIQMPRMDGYQATVAIRESEHPQARTIPIVAMTANVFAEDIEKARIAGMDGHLGKPISMLALIEETNRAIRKQQEGTT